MSDGSAETPSGRLATATGRLAAAGLDPDRAVPQLREAGLWDESGVVDPELIDLISDTTAPGDALRMITSLATTHPERYGRLRADHGWLRRALAVAGTSPPLGDLLVQHDDALSALETLDPVDVAATAAAVEEAVGAADGEEDQAAVVASIRRRATADIAARDLTGRADVEEVAAELAGLAQGVLSGALAALHRKISGAAPAARIGVVGMGKLGGRELNYVSDVDVIFVHTAVGDADDEEAMTEARTTLEALLRLLNASTTMGRAYEIDPTLRPEGRTGALSRTPEAYEAYWNRWAETWEFQALIKARPVAGDLELGADLLRRATPHVWPQQLDPEAVAEIRDMKSRVEARPEVRRHGQRQVKLGPGGLRDIEFAVQLLQLVHGRADERLRVPGTLPALRALTAGGYVAERDGASFADAYRRLRVVEHRLQLAQERRTHTIPDDGERQEWLARACGYRPEAGEPARARFIDDLRGVQAEVRELHAKLFYRPLLEVHAAVSAADAEVALPHQIRAMGEDAALERLHALGFRDGAAALRDVRALTGGVSRRARTVRAILPAVLTVVADSPDPDLGLRMFRRLIDAHGPTSSLLAHLRDHPPAVDLLARVLGTSEVAGELLASHPQGVEWLEDESLRELGRDREALVDSAMARLNWQDPEAALRRFKRHELLRTVLRDLGGAAGVSVVGQELTGLGEACLEAGLAVVLREVAAERDLGGPGELPVRIAIIAMGKLGGRELHYASDLDVMFVHGAVGVPDAEASSIALTVAERVMASLGRITAEGTAFEVDADLRPEGRSGPLSRSLESYRVYYDRWSEQWEHQALLKARVVAGDRDLGEHLLDETAQRAYPRELTEQQTGEIRRMKARIERERTDGSDPHRRDLKLGPGGLTDVEWTVQLLQMRHGADHPALRVPGTMAAVDGLQDESLLEHRDAQWLRDGYRFLWRIRNMLYLLRERTVDVLPSGARKLERLARALGYGRGGRQDLEDDYLRHTRHVRRVAERLFYNTG